MIYFYKKSNVEMFVLRCSFMCMSLGLMTYVGLVLGVVAVTLNVYGIEKVIDAFHFFGSVCHVGRCDIILQVIQTTATGNRNNPRFLIK